MRKILLLMGTAIAVSAGPADTSADDRVTEGMAGERSRGRVLMVIENDRVPEDRRVWAESRTLSDAGWDVAVICPDLGCGGQARVEELDGIEIHRYPLRPAGTTLGYIREYGQALWRTWRLVRRLQRERAFDAVHLGNPPDFLYLAVRKPRARGARLIFDHHDLMPELFRSRFGRAGVPYLVLRAIERHALRTADVVISTNESYRRIAIERGVVPEDVFVVRNGPELARFVPVEPDPSLRGGRPHLIAYLGLMGPQDGIDHALKALAALRQLRPDDWRAVFVGNGEVLEQMRALASELGLADAVEFAGWRGDDDIRRILSTADVCLAPDPPSPLNDVSTMVKIPEYMAMGRAIASYDLPETRISAGAAAAYGETAEPESLARCVHELLEDPGRRLAMGEEGRRRVSRLSWQQSSTELLAAYERVVDPAVKRRATPARGRASSGVAVTGPADDPGHDLR
jgi:glycosyltransferase involved in cell wall biosynthesis